VVAVDAVVASFSSSPSMAAVVTFDAPVLSGLIFARSEPLKITIFI